MKIKISLAQMYMTENMTENLNLSEAFIYHAADKGADIILFPEVQLTQFFAQYKEEELKKAGIDKSIFAISEESEYFTRIRNAAKDAKIMVSPNFYIKNKNGKYYDTSYLINSDGEIIGDSEMVHIFQAEHFYEQDYYTPSESGFKVFDTQFGKIGIVICFDRHMPESIRTCAIMGAELILIPTANLKTEPLDLFESEIRTQAYQNNVFIAMCNRAGKEGNIEFAGESIIADPNGNIIKKSDDSARMITEEIDISEAKKSRESRNYLSVRRKEFYK